MFKKGDQEVLSEMDQSSYSKDRVKIVLSEKHMPTHWYNICSDLPTPLAPPLNPGTGEPIYLPERFVPTFKPSKMMRLRVNELINKSINELLSTLINGSFNIFIIGLTNKPIYHYLINHSLNRSMNHSIHQSMNQLIINK